MIAADDLRPGDPSPQAASSPSGEGCPADGKPQPTPVGKIWDGAGESHRFSYYRAPIRNVNPMARVGLRLVHNLISTEVFKKQTLGLRALEDPAEARHFKATQFDYVTFSGLFTRRDSKCLLEHSGLLCLDFDHLDDPEALKIALIRDKCFETQLVFISPSGDGLKWVVPVEVSPLVSHERWFNSVRHYVEQHYRVEADPSGRDVARACFLPYDPDAWLHPKYLS